MSTDDVLLEGLGIERLALGIVTGEALLRVRDEDTTVGRSFESTEHTGTGRRALQADVEVRLEWSGRILHRLGQGDSAIGLRDTLVLVGEAELGECSAGGKETSRVGWNAR